MPGHWCHIVQQQAVVHTDVMYQLCHHSVVTDSISLVPAPSLTHTHTHSDVNV